MIRARDMGLITSWEVMVYRKYFVAFANRFSSRLENRKTYGKKFVGIQYV